jgi:hypothetical protein
MKPRHLAILLFCTTYVWTGVAVWQDYSRREAATAHEMHEQLLKAHETRHQECLRSRVRDCRDVPSSAFRDGPHSKAIAIPIVPGLAMVWSGYSVSPLLARWSPKVVFWYISGTVELLELGVFFA